MDFTSAFLKERVLLACKWLAQTAMVKETQIVPPTVDRKKFGYTSWKGAIRGEYSPAEGIWWFFCPVWHTGQALKAFVETFSLFPKDFSFLEEARETAGFLLNCQIWDSASPDHGLILAYEDFSDKVNTSAVLETLDGLLAAEKIRLLPGLLDRTVAAGRFLLKRAWIQGEGTFRDVYDPATHSVVLPNPYITKLGTGGRPLLDDGVLLSLYRLTGEKPFLEAHLEIAERLVKDQRPLGNWIDYGPCNAEHGLFHPRHTYWWAVPLIETWRETGKQEFLETAIASGEFCRRAMRADGGWIRNLREDFNTDSFGHATSGSACAAILFLELASATGNNQWRCDARKALEFCCSMQMTHPVDLNLTGCIIEKVLPPDGTDRSPYHVRDIGSIFFIIAGCRYLATQKQEEDKKFDYNSIIELTKPS